MITSLLYLPYLGESVDEADIPVMLVAGHVEGQHVSMGSLCCNFQTSRVKRLECDFSGGAEEETLNRLKKGNAITNFWYKILSR